MHHYQTGLTLIELLIICTLLAILSSYCIPFYEQLQAKQESKKTQLLLKNAINQAKTLAILHKKEMKICPSHDGIQCTPFDWSKNILIYSEHNQTVFEHYPLELKYGNLKWVGSLKKEYIIFQPDTGMPRGHIGRFNYEAKNYQLNFSATLNMMGIFSIHQNTHQV